MKDKVHITPETKVGELLDNYPELEQTLLELAPAFAKLKSPILRRTVGRVATLGQAARIGGVSLGTMLNTLREASGIGHADYSENDTDAYRESHSESGEGLKVGITIDARAMLERGEHPVARVMKELANLSEGESLLLITPFPPLPLIEKGKSKGFVAWFTQEEDELVKTYFSKAK